jgi:hypothetical protein
METKIGTQEEENHVYEQSRFQGTGSRHALLYVVNWRWIEKQHIWTEIQLLLLNLITFLFAPACHDYQTAQSTFWYLCEWAYMR